MSPDQATEVLKALNQHNWFLVVCGIFWILGTILQFLVVTRIKSAIENKQHFSRVRYEREMKVYEDLWPKLYELQAVVLSLRSGFGFSVTENITEDEQILEQKKRYMEAHRAIFLAINHSRPFYAAEIWDQLNQLIKLCSREAVEWGLFSSKRLMQAKENREDYYEKAEKNAEAINKQIDTICDAIRSRLSKFDSI